jgi:GTPase KRas protein
LTNERKVSTEEGMKLAKTLNCLFIETSAKQAINVDECFFQLVREIRKYQQNSSDKPEHKTRQCKLL